MIFVRLDISQNAAEFILCSETIPILALVNLNTSMGKVTQKCYIPHPHPKVLLP